MSHPHGTTEAERREVRAIMVAGEASEINTVDLILHHQVSVPVAAEVDKIMTAGTARSEVERENPHVDSRKACEDASQSLQKSGPLTSPKPPQSPAVASRRDGARRPVKRSFYAFGGPGQPYAPPPEPAA